MNLNILKKLFVLVNLAGSLVGNQAFAEVEWLQMIRPLKDARVIATPDENHDAVVKAIGLAKSSVKMWMYHLTDQAVVQALIQAKARNVNVQVILDQSSMKNSKYMDIFKQLETGRVSVVKSSAQFTLTHTKTFIVDDTLAFISTMNLVGHFQGMRDFGLFTQDADVIRELKIVFAADLENARNNTANTPVLSNSNLIWSPVNSEQKLTDLLDSAQSSIQVAAENLGQTSVLDAMTRAKARGVTVQIITPKCDLNPNPLWNYPFMYTLEKAGANVRVMPGPSSVDTPYMHAKTIVVDGKIAFLGSENFSQNSLRNARETGVVFNNTSGVQKMISIFQKDWMASEPLPSKLPSCPSLTSLLSP